MDTPYIHHGVMFSYYSAKTRAYLSCKRIPFVERYEGLDISRRIADVTHKVMIPVVETPEGEILQDTTEIIDVLEARHPQPPLFPDDPVLMLLTRIVEFIVDELWVSTAMHTRWNDPESKQFAIREFGRRIGGSFGMEGDAALAIGERVAGQMQSYLPNLGIGEAQGQATVQNFFETASKLLNQAVGPVRYAFGERPSLMDVCLFTAYYAHQYRDHGAAVAFLKTQTPDLCYFLDNMHAAQCAPDSGALSLTEPFLDYLRYVGPAGAGFAQGIVAATTQAAAEVEVGKVFQQGYDPFEFELGGRPFARSSSSFSAWKAQRIHEVYQTLDPQQRERADEIAADVGWQQFLHNPPQYRLVREDYQIRLQA